MSDAPRPPAVPVFIGSEIYRHSSYGAWHPLRVPRTSTVIDMVRALGWLAPGQYRVSPRAKAEGLTLWHTPDYVAALMQAEAAQAVTPLMRERHHLGTAMNPVYPEMFRRPATGAGAAMLAAALLAGGGAVHAPGMGTHHGLPDRANGFCFLNDLVLGILSLRRHGLGRIAYIDIDAHHGDGVEHAFAADPDVMVLSVHEAGRWPRTGALSDRGVGNVFNLPVPPGLNDDEFAAIRDGLILPVLARFRPEAVVLQCGADALAEDPLSRLSLSNNAHVALLRALRGMAPRLVVTGGGGYNPWTVGRLWTRNWAALNDLEEPDRLPDPAVAVLSGLRFWRAGQERRAEPHLLTTLVDPPRGGPVRAEIRAAIAELVAPVWV